MMLPPFIFACAACRRFTAAQLAYNLYFRIPGGSAPLAAGFTA